MSETIKLIYTELGENSNKFWHATLDGSTVTYEWGRIGNDNHQTKTIPFPSDEAARKNFESKKNSKLKKGYTVQRTAGAAPAMASGNLAQIARTQIAGAQDPETRKLIDFLVKRNVHAIEGATDITFNAATGQLTTPLGLVTIEGLDEADELLVKIAERMLRPGFASLVNQYLRIVPQKIGHRGATAEEIFPDLESIKKATDLVATLRSIVETADKDVAAQAPQIFKTKLEVVRHGSVEFSRVMAMYTGSRNARHTSYNMRLTRVWSVEIAGAEAAFERDLAPIMELWHGTQDSNLLSILKGGYIIPKQGGTAKITGRMFGDGVYFSDQSTKSLNYATGYWGGNSQRRFMLLNEVAMGRIYTPSGAGSRRRPAGYDSTFARAGRSGVINNEMVVSRTSQIRPRYLCEFG